VTSSFLRRRFVDGSTSTWRRAPPPAEEKEEGGREVKCPTRRARLCCAFRLRARPDSETTRESEREGGGAAAEAEEAEEDYLSGRKSSSFSERQRVSLIPREFSLACDVFEARYSQSERRVRAAGHGRGRQGELQVSRAVAGIPLPHWLRKAEKTSTAGRGSRRRGDQVDCRHSPKRKSPLAFIWPVKRGQAEEIAAHKELSRLKGQTKGKRSTGSAAFRTSTSGRCLA